MLRFCTLVAESWGRTPSQLRARIYKSCLRSSECHYLSARWRQRFLAAKIAASMERIKDQFVGAWRLVSFEAPGPDGKIQKTESTGMFVFTRDGHASVQVMERNPSQRRLRRGLSSTREAATKPLLEPTKWMKPRTGLLSMWEAR